MGTSMCQEAGQKLECCCAVMRNSLLCWYKVPLSIVHLDESLSGSWLWMVCMFHGVSHRWKYNIFFASSLETVDDGNGSKLSLDKILEELGTTFSYVSEFLRKVWPSQNVLRRGLGSKYACCTNTMSIHSHLQFSRRSSYCFIRYAPSITLCRGLQGVCHNGAGVQWVVSSLCRCLRRRAWHPSCTSKWKTTRKTRSVKRSGTVSTFDPQEQPAPGKEAAWRIGRQQGLQGLQEKAFSQEVRLL